MKRTYKVSQYRRRRSVSRRRSTNPIVFLIGLASFWFVIEALV